MTLAEQAETVNTSMDFILTPLSLALPFACMAYLFFKKKKVSRFCFWLIGCLAVSNAFAHASGIGHIKEIQEIAIVLTSLMMVTKIA